MSYNTDWNIDKYRDEHESDDHWQLRRSFMEKWKNNFPEQRLVCLARVFTNIELLGCRYPQEVMQEISHLSKEVAEPYRKLKKTMLQRTFVSASDAAEDRAKGIKRKGGVVIDDQPKAKIQFIAAGTTNENNDNDSDNETKSNNVNSNNDVNISNDDNRNNDISTNNDNEIEDAAAMRNKLIESYNYLEELLSISCVDVRRFRDYMFNTTFGRMVLLIRPWASKIWNIQTSCQACHIELSAVYKNRTFTLTINGQMIAESSGESKAEARRAVESVVWERMKHEVIMVLVKEQFIAQNDTRISVSDVSGRRNRDDEFGTPVENSVAMKMMQMMGWKGGGLGADAQGIAEPIKPNLQMVNRAGLGSTSSDIRQLRKAAYTLMGRYIASDTLDLDLVFSSEFSKEERALLHQCAQKLGLASRSYGDKDRFLVVKKKLDPFSLARAVIDKGGVSPKYQVFIPEKLASKNIRNY